MFRTMVTALTKIKAAARRLVKAALDRVEKITRRLWQEHSHRMKSDASYAAAAAVVLASCFGAVPATEALAAVVAMLLGVAMSNRRSYSRPTYDQGVSRWNTNPDWDAEIGFA
ncbi:hypothetical protein [uncultured Jatrophihabitans sp.]|uniref:hypothetical protein n=1 Tax=uncultured Jatrophihabitans sp. TaxID=1610747 RepID=UPI0035CB2BF8